MTVDEILQKLFEGSGCDKPALDAFCKLEEISVTVLFEKAARSIVTGYMDGRFTWQSCDTAMNALSGWMTAYREFPDFPWRAYLAFDAGEYHPRTPDLSPDEITRPLIG